MQDGHVIGWGVWRECQVWQRNLYVLWAIEFAAFAGLSLILPFLPLHIRRLGVTSPTDVARWSGLVLAAPFMVSFLTTPVWGALGDRYGQKLMVVRALLGGAACYVGMALAATVGGLFGWRLALGAVSGFLAAGLALVSVTVPDGQRGYALGLLHGVVPAAALIGPLIGGMLADAMGYRPVVILVAIICASGGVAGAALLVDVRAPLGTGGTFPLGESPPLRRARQFFDCRRKIRNTPNGGLTRSPFFVYLFGNKLVGPNEIRSR